MGGEGDADEQSGATFSKVVPGKIEHVETLVPLERHCETESSSIGDAVAGKVQAAKGASLQQQRCDRPAPNITKIRLEVQKSSRGDMFSSGGRILGAIIRDGIVG